MDNIFANIIILPMLGYFKIFQGNFYCYKLFHLAIITHNIIATNND